MVGDTAQGKHCRRLRLEIDRRPALPVGVNDCDIVWDHEDGLINELASDPVRVLGVGDLVRNDCHAALLAIGRGQDGPFGNVNRARSGLNDDQRGVNRCVRKPGQRADARLEVGDDDGVGVGNGAEQLLSGQPASRSIRFGIVDSVYDSETYPIGRIGSVRVEDVVPCVSVRLAAFIDLVAK